MGTDNPSIISTSLIYNALDFYGNKCGYRMIDVPMCVSFDAIKPTIPPNITCLNHNDLYYVGSAEQGFIQLFLENKISYGLYMALTPCHRNEFQIDNLHFQIFLKLELIWLGHKEYDMILEDAKNFFSQNGFSVKKQKTEQGIDLYCKGVELGSYGTRYLPNGMPYSYGTGLAEPRASFVKSM